MSIPTRKQIHDAYEALETLTDTCIHSSEQAEELRDLVRLVLPPIPHSTMAEVNWEHSKHFLTVAESTRDDERYIMLCPEMSEHIRCISEDPYRSTEVILREYLVPTNDKYLLNWKML